MSNDNLYAQSKIALLFDIRHIIVLVILILYCTIIK